MASAKPKPAAAPPARPATTPRADAPLRFDDDDLNARYHGAPPPEAADEDPNEAAPEAGGLPGAPAAPAKPGQPVPPGKTPDGKPAPPKAPPVPRPAPTPADPLKAFHDREANEKFRTEQIEQLRAQIAQTQSRLDYLNQRRLAVLDPLRIPPKAPEGEEQVDPKLKPKELLEQIDGEIATVSSELDDLKARLVTIETRFQKESGGR